MSPYVLLGVGLDLTGVDGRDGTREVGVEGLVDVNVVRALGVDDLVDVTDCELVLSIEGDGREIDVIDAELVLRIEDRLKLEE